MWFPPIKEDDYIGYGNVDKVQEEPFGELMVLLCQWMKQSNNGFHCFCHQLVNLFIEREAEVLEVIDVQNESFGERMNNSLPRKC